MEVTEYLFGMAMFVDEFNDMKYIVRAEIDTYLGQ